MDDRDEQLPAHPTGEGDRPRLGGEDRCRGRDRDVDPAVARPERCVGRVEPPDHRSLYRPGPRPDLRRRDESEAVGP